MIKPLKETFFIVALGQLAFHMGALGDHPLPSDTWIRTAIKVWHDPYLNSEHNRALFDQVYDHERTMQNAKTHVFRPKL